VLNFGLPDLSGMTVSGTDVAALERTLRQAISDFEPRILRHRLRPAGSQ
jgi:type VI secretion system protein ImpF